MKITIEINCDNAAFEDDAGGEIARILNSIASEAQEFYHPTNNRMCPVVRDINGNKVGTVTVEE